MVRVCFVLSKNGMKRAMEWSAKLNFLLMKVSVVALALILLFSSIPNRMVLIYEDHYTIYTHYQLEQILNTVGFLIFGMNLTLAYYHFMYLNRRKILLFLAANTLFIYSVFTQYNYLPKLEKSLENYVHIVCLVCYLAYQSLLVKQEDILLSLFE
eukprot:TRINITY_DN6565_c0_g2_i1.p1 TRINITY_DN6565_c0_g2~~TRINITY_DN6565_c0_g2_i1.p1  ORF type:complete len:155 (+),score=31.75 TRINITY_DN6565_c0_g2_i1:350-814(+)